MADIAIDIKLGDMQNESTKYKMLCKGLLRLESCNKLSSPNKI